MNYPGRGAGGFSGLRRAGAGESRGSQPVQQLDVSEYMTASEAGSERGRRRHRGYQEDRPSVGREDVGRSFDQEDREPAGCRVVMSNQRFLKIVCFRFPINVPKKIEYIRF